MQAAGLIISLVLHGALLGWAALEILGVQKLPEPAAPTIEAEIITLAEFTNLKKGDPEAKKLEAKLTPEEPPQVTEKEAPKPKPEPPKPPPAAEEPPPPEPPKPDPIAEALEKPAPLDPVIGECMKQFVSQNEIDGEQRKKLEEECRQEIERKKKAEEQARIEAEKKKEAAEKKKAEEKRKQDAEEKKKLAEAKKKREEAKKKAKKKKQEDFSKRMAALLDKTPEERGSKRSGTSQDTDYTGPTAGEREGQGTQLTAREEDLLKGRISSQIRDCWRLPGGGGGIDTAVVTVRWRLQKDGSLDGLPQIVGSRSDPVYRIAGEAAVRAVTCAAPFKLPPDMYASWKEITWEFDPRHML
ncbi:MAG: cell envelope integrity protein TolA [Alphaproteobacteria bacterium]|nr:cell envelope integrity protein TolA [Alphaproteobacteria bacterium]